MRSLLIVCLCAAPLSAASFSTDGIAAQPTFRETRVFTIAPDAIEDTTVELTAELRFVLDDETDTARVVSFSSTTVPDLPPITSISSGQETVFIPGDFPEPGRFETVETVTELTIDLDALPESRTLFIPGGEFLHAVDDLTPKFLDKEYQIAEDENGFYFDYSHAAQTILTGTAITSTSTNGGAPVITEEDISQSLQGSTVVRFRIQEDLSLTMESGSLFRSSGFLKSGLLVQVPFAVIPEPSSFTFVLLSGFTALLLSRQSSPTGCPSTRRSPYRSRRRM